MKQKPLSLALAAACGIAVLASPVLVAQDQPQRPGKDVTAPRLLREVKAEYTPAAIQARVEGSVMLEVLIGEDGKVGGVRVVKSLDTEHGLDEQAVNAVEQWEFAPGTRDGKPVPVLVDVEISFRLE